QCAPTLQAPQPGERQRPAELHAPDRAVVAEVPRGAPRSEAKTNLEHDPEPSLDSTRGVSSPTEGEDPMADKRAPKTKYWSRGGGEGPWDTVVIGSGMGGMTTAALLAKLGEKVLVLEQHYVPGGFTHTFTRKGYTWDVGVHAVG